MSAYDDDASRLADPCEGCGKPNAKCSCDEPELPSRRQLTARARSAETKLLAAYFGIRFHDAVAKYAELKKSGELETILESARQGQRSPEATANQCPICGGEMAERNGSRGPFWGCCDYPRCRGTRSIVEENRKPTEQQKKAVGDKMAAALAFVEAVGGVAEARKYLYLAGQALEGETE